MWGNPGKAAPDPLYVFDGFPANLFNFGHTCAWKIFNLVQGRDNIVAQDGSYPGSYSFHDCFLLSKILFSGPPYTTGITKSVRRVDVAKPKTTTDASGLCTSEPAPVASSRGRSENRSQCGH
jgi:hypothetical protein